MSLPPFADIISLSNKQISEEILNTENMIFNLHFKKATRQKYKSHQLKKKKHKLAQLKTLLTRRLKENISKKKI